ncbi:EexN family lipoprotein [Enterobacter quasiroggenkampii]|uniref:EexN family lipoprotein n=1 Tax=Enterobacter quasiroggenkampii TaxID=2497436 RepID=UPI0021CF4C46|nr:EexN family lipoprotein [Enterobacter quasiroggenkampii]MCU6278878.1 EexN family lipoprotein [Enterobacter quasiroggenkampii]MCU6401172.1 EexN family lipoprotein [Enterobacter quasiroggenkampii]
MKKAFTIIIALSAIINLSACKDEKSEAWYKQHPEETYKRYSQCLNDGEASMDCEFSYRAALMFAHAGKTEFKQLFKQKEELRRKAIK